ncbi:hypothetical protein N7453_008454 [Penicillium expansum]|nr:hypothetical protein N7453_008454 [Penicillium expansum]
MLSKIDSATSIDDTSESNIRFTLDTLMVYAHDIASSGHIMFGRRSHIQTERQWNDGLLKWNQKSYRLVGKPDYEIRHGEEEETTLNVVFCSSEKGV